MNKYCGEITNNFLNRDRGDIMKNFMNKCLDKIKNNFMNGYSTMEKSKQLNEQVLGYCGNKRNNLMNKY